MHPSYLASEEIALLEVGLEGIEGCDFGPYQTITNSSLELPDDDIRARLPEDVILEKHPEVTIWYDGKRTIDDPSSQWFEFTGKVGDLDLQGIDLITLNGDGRVQNLDVLMRPVNAVIALREAHAIKSDDWSKEFDARCEQLAESRPTAVNLRWAVERCRALIHQAKRSGASFEDIETKADAEARTIQEEDQAMQQWLRRIPDDPSGLLREKFRYESRQRQEQGDGQENETYW